MKNIVLLSGACGAGKSTIINILRASNMLANYVCVDTDEVGINWWDYAGTDNEHRFSDDCIAEAVQISGDKNLLFGTCLSPTDYYEKISIPQGVTSTYFIGMVCSDAEIIDRLKARPKERMCGSDEFIASQIQYNNWFKQNAGKFQLFIDNTNQSVKETAMEIAIFLNRY